MCRIARWDLRNCGFQIWLGNLLTGYIPSSQLGRRPARIPFVSTRVMLSRASCTILPNSCLPSLLRVSSSTHLATKSNVPQKVKRILMVRMFARRLRRRRAGALQVLLPSSSLRVKHLLLLRLPKLLRPRNQRPRRNPRSRQALKWEWTNF